MANKPLIYTILDLPEIEEIVEGLNLEVESEEGGSARLTLEVLRSFIRNGVLLEALRNQPNGFAGLNESGLIDSALLPGYVDDVEEYETFEDFPAVGEKGKIYLETTYNKCYRWGDTQYVILTAGDVVSVNGRKGVVVGLVEQEDFDVLAANVYRKNETSSKSELDLRFAAFGGSELTNYSLPIGSTAGAMNLATNNVFKITAGSGRALSFSNIPSNRAVVAVLKIMGNGTVTWPGGITWVDDQAPTLGSSFSIINLLFIDGSIIGSVMKTV